MPDQLFVLHTNCVDSLYGTKSEIYKYFLNDCSSVWAEHRSDHTSYYIHQPSIKTEPIEISFFQFLNYYKFASVSLVKTRFEYAIDSHPCTIDLYKTNPSADPYFIVASTQADLTEHVLYRVPSSEKHRYSEYSLAHSNYARIQYQLLKESYGS